MQIIIKKLTGGGRRGKVTVVAPLAPAHARWMCSMSLWHFNVALFFVSSSYFQNLTVPHDLNFPHLYFAVGTPAVRTFYGLNYYCNNFVTLILSLSWHWSPKIWDNPSGGGILSNAFTSKWSGVISLWRSRGRLAGVSFRRISTETNWIGWVTKRHSMRTPRFHRPKWMEANVKNDLMKQSLKV
jgi:hypothetical protein